MVLFITRTHHRISDAIMIKFGLFLPMLLAVTVCYAALDCPADWKEFEGSCYKVVNKFSYSRKFVWWTASRVCPGFGGDLVSISNEREMGFVYNLSSPFGSTPVWIGLAYRFQKGEYLWSNGGSFNSSVSGKWLGEISRNVGKNKCAEILRNGWNLTDCCKENKYIICERAKGPLVCSADWFLGGSSCFKEHNKDTWKGAKQGCSETGGHLMKIDNSVQRHFLIRFLEISGLKGANIDYVWIDKTNNSKCIRMKTDTGTMEDGNCEELQNYVCEKPARSSICYQYPSKNSSVPIAVKCSFPENLCFKFVANYKQVTIQGCISADQCRQFDDQHLHCCEGDLCNSIAVIEATKSTLRNDTTISKIIYISLGVTSAILLLAIAIIVWCYRRTKKKTVQRLPYPQREIRPLDEWEILPEQIEIEEELGRGAFGVVYKATFRKRVGMEVFDAEITKRTLLSDKKPPQVVAVKGLHDDPSDAQKEEFTFEIEQMKLLGSHKNIVSLVGWYTLKDQNFLVVEYVPFGDLLTWLRCRRKEDEKFKVTDKEFLSSPSASPGTASQAFNSAMSLSIENLKESDEVLCDEESFSTEQLFSFALQIAKGMNHLAENRFVHRDLAARNVLVGHGNQVKVADFGLMRQIYEDVYSSGKSKKLPVKWMAPESLYQGLYTTKSDVWAYGVLLWEMSTLGGVPYPTLTNTELYRLLGTGYRMERPDMSSDDVYELMTDCWKEEPCSRPSFFQLIEKLEVIMQRDAPYLDLDKHNEDHPYYNVPPEASGDEEGNMEKEEPQDATSIDSYL